LEFVVNKVPQADFPAFEAEMLQRWEQEKTFEQSMEQRRGAKRFSFYDGPPFANGLPHFGHSLVTSIKDSLGRYRTMRGYYVDRRNGWDCHGLPVEFAIEKQMGVSGKKQILDLGIDKFNQACRDSVFLYKGDWEAFYRRIGRWTDTDRAYATIDRDFTESVWWGLSQVHQKGLLYRGYKSMPYCPRCETPLSNFELNEGYRDDVSDPSVYLKFQLANDENAFLLAWTTTPWTLPANAALAVDENAQYVTLQMTADGDSWSKDELMIVAKERIDVLTLRNAEFEVKRGPYLGKELVGLRYKPLFSFTKLTTEESQAAFTVYADESVSLEDGTGILHVAPRYGESDLGIGQREGLPLIESVGQNGHMTERMGEFAGKFFKSADPLITADLVSRGLIFAAETFQHTYPFCYRCESPLLYFAISSWFIRVSAIREQLLATAEQIDWTPGHIKSGRFGKWLEGARDWAVSRNRYWGAPMPIWVNTQDESDYIVVSSIEELRGLAGKDVDLEDLHRPGIDQVTFQKDGKTYKRIEEVFDCWFESGSMPFAQQHYPFENKQVFEESFPADYIGEGLDQTRLWFYVQHVLATIIFDRPAYKHVLVNGMVMAADGQKLSKRLKNYPPVDEVFGREGADTLRFYLLSNDQALGADYMRFNREAMADVTRNVFSTLWNSLSFLSMYAEIDGWKPEAHLSEPVSDSVLDRWMVSRLNQVVGQMTEAADGYELAQALRPYRLLVDDLSNWYVRRSRRRFWKSEDDADKQSAYQTLHYVLARMAQLLAPWSPFVADKIWRELMAGTKEPTSVHLSDWPKAGEVDELLLEQMTIVRQVINEALARRAEAGIKVRQPLASLKIICTEDFPRGMLDIISEEINVQRIEPDRTRVDKGFVIELDTNITDELRREGIVRDLIRLVQSARKQAGLEVDDRIVLRLLTPSEDIQAAAEQFDTLIVKETLTEHLTIELGSAGAAVPQKLSDSTIVITVTKSR
jgi:isoleucyl-tRNA synthetase